VEQEMKSLLEVFISHMGVEVRIIKRQGRYIVKIYPDYESEYQILSRSDADFNKAQMKAYYALLNMQGMSEEKTKAIKQELKDTLDKLNQKPLVLFNSKQGI
jgi:hypothetical protein